MRNRVRRMAMAAVMVGVTLAGTFVVASPAQAACGLYFQPMFQNGYLSATHYRYCWDPDAKIDLPVKIEKHLNSGPFPWAIVAQAYGTAAYQCQGNEPNAYSINGKAPSVYACG